jgi:hypothetical protein
MDANAGAIAHLIQFIGAYRRMEKAPLTHGYNVIGVVVKEPSTRNHLKGKWRSNEKAFGRFYLNLSWENRYGLQTYFGIPDSMDRRFVADCESDPVAMLFEEPTGFMSLAHKLLLFFNNHGIDEVPAPGITLTYLPKNPSSLISEVVTAKEMYCF